MRISDWSSDVCSSDLLAGLCRRRAADQYRKPRADSAAVLRAATFMPDLVGNRQSARRVGGGTDAGALGGTARVQRAGRRWRCLARLHPCRTRYRSEEHTSELQSLMRISYAVFCLKKKPTSTTSESQYT